MRLLVDGVVSALGGVRKIVFSCNNAVSAGDYR